VVMVERDRAVAAGLRESARVLQAEGVEVVESEALAYLKRCSEKFDIVFLDPPYAGDLAERALAELAPHLNRGARVYVEAAEAPAAKAPWRTLREDHAGAVRYALLEIIDP
jgi:16S rRNA (guanine966-N2)-methyltransferase